MKVQRTIHSVTWVTRSGLVSKAFWQRAQAENLAIDGWGSLPCLCGFQTQHINLTYLYLWRLTSQCSMNQCYSNMGHTNHVTHTANFQLPQYQWWRGIGIGVHIKILTMTQQLWACTLNTHTHKGTSQIRGSLHMEGGLWLVHPELCDLSNEVAKTSWTKKTHRWYILFYFPFTYIFNRKTQTTDQEYPCTNKTSILWCHERKILEYLKNQRNIWYCMKGQGQFRWLHK